MSKMFRFYFSSLFLFLSIFFLIVSLSFLFFIFVLLGFGVAMVLGVLVCSDGLRCMFCLVLRGSTGAFLRLFPLLHSRVLKTRDWDFLVFLFIFFLIFFWLFSFFYLKKRRTSVSPASFESS